MEKIKLGFKEYLDSFSFFLVVALLGEQMGLYFSATNRIFDAFVLLLYVIINYESWRFNKNRPNPHLLFWGTIITAVLASLAPLPAIGIGFALLLPIIWRREQSLNLQVGLLFFTYVLFREYVPQFFQIEHLVADGFNTLLRRITSFKINFSPTTYGFGVLIIILGYSFWQVCQLPRTRKALYIKLPLVLFSLICYFGFQVLYFWASTFYLSLPKPSGFGFDYYFYYMFDLLFPMNGQGVIFVVLFMITAGFQFILLRYQPSKIEVSKPSSTWELSNPVKIIVIIVFFIILVSLFRNIDIYDYRPSSQKPTIYVYQSNNMDFTTVPDEGIFGVHNGFWGMMPDYLKDWGYQVQSGRNWKSLRPKKHDILLLINPNGMIPASEKKALKSFIYHGGCVLVLGDHTYMFGLKNDYFDFTKEMGIAFNFDTAIYFREDWKKCVRSPYPTWNEMAKREDYAIGISQGASLSVNFPAAPLIIGQYAWSDAGNLKNVPGYLGNRAYETWEPTGDTVLAAERDYGKGKLMVFGDTSFSQNSPISSTYPLFRLCLAHLTPSEGNWGRFFYPVIFLILAAIYLFCQKYWGQKLGISNFSGLIILVLFFIWLGSLLGSPQKYFETPGSSNYLRAGIDNTFFPDHYQRDWTYLNRGIGGLKNTIYRTKVLPYVVYRYGTATKLNLDYLVIMAPNRQITKSEAEKILGFVKAGGVLIVTCGYDRYIQNQEFLNLLKVKIKNTPLAYLTEKDTDPKLRFVSAWPVMGIGQNKLKVLCKAWEQYPLIIEETIGKGKAIVVGDSYFLENRDLEEGDSYYQYNQDFVKQMFSNFKR